MHPKEYPDLEPAAGGAPFDTLLVPAQRGFAAIGCGNTKGYELIAEGRLIARKLGSRTMIETRSLRAYVAGLPRVPAKAA